MLNRQGGQTVAVQLVCCGRGYETERSVQSRREAAVQSAVANPHFPTVSQATDRLQVSTETVNRGRLLKTRESSASLVYFSALEHLSTLKRLITASELAELLGCNRMTVYRMVKGGRIACFRLAGTILFEPKAVAEYLHAREVR